MRKHLLTHKKNQMVFVYALLLVWLSWNLNSCQLKPLKLHPFGQSPIQSTNHLFWPDWCLEENKTNLSSISMHHTNNLWSEHHLSNNLVDSGDPKQDGWWALGSLMCWVILIWGGTRSSEAQSNVSKAGQSRMTLLIKSVTLSLWNSTLQSGVALC